MKPGLLIDRRLRRSDSGCDQPLCELTLFNVSHLFQREDLLSGHVQIVAFYLPSPGPGEEVPQQGGL